MSVLIQLGKQWYEGELCHNGCISILRVLALNMKAASVMEDTWLKDLFGLGWRKG